MPFKTLAIMAFYKLRFFIICKLPGRLLKKDSGVVSRWLLYGFESLSAKSTEINLPYYLTISYGMKKIWIYNFLENIFKWMEQTSLEFERGLPITISTSKTVILPTLHPHTDSNLLSDH